MSKLSEVIDEFNKYSEVKVGDLMSNIECIYYDGGISEMGTSTIRIYVKDLLNAHFIKRLGNGWYSVNEELDNIPQLKAIELKALKKYDNLTMVLRQLKIMRLKEIKK